MIKRSSTYVIDLDVLQDPDDVKRITLGFGITLDHTLTIFNVVSQIMEKYKLGKQYFLQMMIMSSFP